MFQDFPLESEQTFTKIYCQTCIKNSIQHPLHPLSKGGKEYLSPMNSFTNTRNIYLSNIFKDK